MSSRSCQGAFHPRGRLPRARPAGGYFSSTAARIRSETSTPRRSAACWRTAQVASSKTDVCLFHVNRIHQVSVAASRKHLYEGTGLSLRSRSQLFSTNFSSPTRLKTRRLFARPYFCFERFLRHSVLLSNQDPGRSHRRPGKPAGTGNSGRYTLSGTNSSRLFVLRMFNDGRQGADRKGAVPELNRDTKVSPILRIGNHPEGPQETWGRFPTCPLRSSRARRSRSAVWFQRSLTIEYFPERLRPPANQYLDQPVDMQQLAPPLRRMKGEEMGSFFRTHFSRLTGRIVQLGPMRIDWYTKGVLTVIAVFLGMIAAREYWGPVGVVQAQGAFAGVQFSGPGLGFFDTRSGEVVFYQGTGRCR